jgi:hypothetical protein
VDDWKLYRTRFLARARRLDQPLSVTNGCGRQQEGGPGDYLVEAPDGSHRIAPAEVFEDIYVELEAVSEHPGPQKTRVVGHRAFPWARLFHRTNSRPRA